MSTSTMLVSGHKDLAFAGPLGSLDAYISKVVQVPVLSQAEELALARRFTTTTIWMPPASWCFPSSVLSCTSRAATPAMACRSAT